ncbi:MAG: AhpC/TSA family protein [Acidimicrobiales bacterium]
MAQLRHRHDEITRKGAEVVAIGTGDQGYARAFVSEEDVPFLVLVDDEGSAAAAASVPKAGPGQLIGLRTLAGSRAAWRAGHRVHRSGRRVRQLGATFVIGPGAHLHYSHVDAHSSDHAPLSEVLDSLP